MLIYPIVAGLILYDTVDRRHFLTTLEGNGAGPHMRELLSEFCERQDFITRKNGYHGHHFKATWETT